jgi:hypothetical protein
MKNLATSREVSNPNPVEESFAASGGEFDPKRLNLTGMAKMLPPMMELAMPVFPSPDLPRRERGMRSVIDPALFNPRIRSH